MPSKCKYFAPKLHNVARWTKEEMAYVDLPPTISPPTRFASMLSRSAGEKSTARHNAFAEPWRESFHLILDFLQHVFFRSVGNVTVGPRRMLTGGRPRIIEQTWLNQQDERAIDGRPIRIVFRSGLYLQSSAQVHRCCAQTLRGLPGNRGVQRIIHFKYARSVAETLQAPAYSHPKTVVRQFLPVVAAVKSQSTRS